jgi:uncharacterized membrane protein YeaQ/YmgE (transglycosylase-associated protein family)
MPDLTYWTELLLDRALSPALWLGVVAALACTVPFIILRGGGPGQVVRDVVAGLTGFAAGQLFGVLMGTDPLYVGQVHLMWGVLGSVTALFLGRLVWRRPSVG